MWRSHIDESCHIDAGWHDALVCVTRLMHSFARHMCHTSASCHEWVTSHTYMSPVTYVKESYEWVVPHRRQLSKLIHGYVRHASCIWSRVICATNIHNTQITLNEEAGRALRSTSTQSSDPCQVAQYPQQRHGALWWISHSYVDRICDRIVPQQRHAWCDVFVVSLVVWRVCVVLWRVCSGCCHT